MNLPEPSSLDFTVYHLSFEPGDDGHPAQITRHCGSFASVDAALLLARHLALQEVQRLEEGWAERGESGAVEFVDTEWGYDIRHDGWLLARSWVRDASAARLLAAE